MDLRYPVGTFETPLTSTLEERAGWIQVLARLPGEIAELTAGTTKETLQGCYRPGGWTALQVIHHIADSHLNAYVRLKLALTEDRPTIKPYNEAAWSELRDAQGPVQDSVNLLLALHARWVLLLRELDEAQWEREFVHPEMGVVRVDQQTAHYAWHSRHHLSHIKAALGR